MNSPQIVPPLPDPDVRVQVCQTTVQYTLSDGVQHPIKYRAFLSETTDFGRKPLFVSRRTVYRFVHSSLDALENFLPVAFLPPRIHNTQEAHKKANNFSLSVYASEQQMRNKFTELKEDYPQIVSRIGNHFTTFTIDTRSGCHTRVNTEGHLDLHEHERFNPRAVSAPSVEI